MERNPNEAARKIVDNALTRLAAELQADRNESLMNYLEAMSRFRHHSARNVLLISAQRPDATNVAGLHTWNDLGRGVKEGEKGILIFAQGARSRAAYVFDVIQTEGKPLPETTARTRDPKEHAEAIKALLAKRGIEPKSPAEDASALIRELARDMIDHGKDAAKLSPETKDMQELCLSSSAKSFWAN